MQPRWHRPARAGAGPREEAPPAPADEPTDRDLSCRSTLPAYERAASAVRDGFLDAAEAAARAALHRARAMARRRHLRFDAARTRVYALPSARSSATI